MGRPVKWRQILFRSRSGRAWVPVPAPVCSCVHERPLRPLQAPKPPSGRRCLPARRREVLPGAATCCAEVPAGSVARLDVPGVVVPGAVAAVHAGDDGLVKMGGQVRQIGLEPPDGVSRPGGDGLTGPFGRGGVPIAPVKCGLIAGGPAVGYVQASNCCRGLSRPISEGTVVLTWRH